MRSQPNKDWVSAPYEAQGFTVVDGETVMFVDRQVSPMDAWPVVVERTDCKTGAVLERFELLASFGTTPSV